MVQEIAKAAPVAAKVIRTAGLPVVFRIERKDGDYYGTVVNPVAGVPPVSEPAS